MANKVRITTQKYESRRDRNSLTPKMANLKNNGRRGSLTSKSSLTARSPASHFGGSTSASNTISNQINTNSARFLITYESDRDINSRVTDAQSRTGSKKRIHVRKRGNIRAEAERALINDGFTSGLIKALKTNKKEFALRIWIADNSGSMNCDDAQQFVVGSNTRCVRCRRWDELRECLAANIRLSSLLQNPSHFTLLNEVGISEGPRSFAIGEDFTVDHETEVDAAVRVINDVKPSGNTPLIEHLITLCDELHDRSDDLKNKSQKVAIIITTDGLPTNEWGEEDENSKEVFKRILRSLSRLQAWIVIRLCTSDEEVIDFFNTVDLELEMSLDILRNHVEESKEVYRHQRWLNYALPLHQFREMGCHLRVFDFLDERKLTLSELREFCVVLFGDKNLPDPTAEWDYFVAALVQAQRNEQTHWSTIKMRRLPWINIPMLEKEYGQRRRFLTKYRYCKLM